MGVTHATVATGTDAGTGEIHKAEWNAGHTITFVGAKATNTAGTSIADNTPTAMPLATEDFDTNGYHDNSTNNSRMTVPSGLAGKHLVQGQYTIGSAFAANSVYALIRKNGSSDHAFERSANDSGASTGRNISVTLELAVGDYVELIVNQNSGSAKTLETTAGYNWLSIEWRGT